MRTLRSVIGLAIAVLLAGCAGVHHPKPALNDDVRDGNFVFTVTALSLGVPKTGPRTAQGTFVVVNLMVRNTGAAAQPVYCQDQTLKDRAGKKYDNAVNLDNREDRTVIQPRHEVHVKCAFDVPTGTLPTSLTVRDSRYAKGATITLM